MPAAAAASVAAWAPSLSNGGASNSGMMHHPFAQTGYMCSRQAGCTTKQQSRHVAFTHGNDVGRS